MLMSKSEEEIIGCLPEKGWISAEQLALYLNVNKETLKKNIERLGIKRIVIAGKWLISIADFERVARK
ncbi:MAG: hypothetical protein DRN09_02045 [Thermoplasmata archaeon]|nr:MAG: hypothetical protein DRN09_02045 [Thermoplasmata archaeon]